MHGILNRFATVVLLATLGMTGPWNEAATADEPLAETWGEASYGRDDGGGEYYRVDESVRFEGTEMDAVSWFDGSPGTALSVAATGSAAEVSRAAGDGGRAETSGMLVRREGDVFDVSRSSGIVEREVSGEVRLGESLLDATVMEPRVPRAPFDFTVGSRSAGDSRSWGRSDQRSLPATPTEPQHTPPAPPPESSPALPPESPEPAEPSVLDVLGAAIPLPIEVQ